MAFIFRVDSSTTNDTGAGTAYNNVQLFGDDATPGIRVGIALLNNSGAAGIRFWVYDGAFKATPISTNLTFGQWAYAVVKKAGTTLSLSVRGEPFLNTTGVGNITATAQRAKFGFGAVPLTFFDGRFRAMIHGHWVQNDFDRFYNYCTFRLGIA